MIEIKVTRGDLLTWQFDLGINITGMTPVWAAKPEETYPLVADGAASLTATIGAGLTVSDAVNGIVDLAIPSASTAALVPGRYVWGLRLLSGSSYRTIEWDANGTNVGLLIVQAGVLGT